MNGTHLPALEGTNPLGFFAALGVQVAFATGGQRPRLWWSNDITPHAVVDGAFGIDRIATHVLDAFSRLQDCFAINPIREDGSKIPKGDELKLVPGDIRLYLDTAVRQEYGELATALVAEGSLDNQGVAKPSDFYFTAGQQKFLDTARKILKAAVCEKVVRDLEGPWRYESEVPSLGWDVTDDRVYALRANNPSPEKKLTNPVPEALAILGLSLNPVFAGQERTLTQGCSGKWKTGWYSWPIWRKPASFYAVKTLLAHAYNHPADSYQSRRPDWYPSWGVFKIFRSPIRRTDQGGYGTFGPPEVVWSS
ncbi:MAG: hypothetical protein OXE51_10890 [Gammaproteobacteria bacterium]|nr:hypothetical protein [Gammaproteobacteria bacterium]